jgi:hypothetical protein
MIQGAGEALAKVRRKGPPQIGAAQLDRGDPPALQHGRKAAHRRLDFGQLRHDGG